VSTNENDENGGSTRLTRAKAAALGGPEDAVNGGIVKKALQTKKSTGTTLSNGNPRKRAALGDVSNVTKAGEAEGKDGKKAANGKLGLASKATTGAGVQKLTRTNSARSILGTKDNNKKATSTTELKRPASGSGVLGNIQKKRQTASNASSQTIKEQTPNNEEPPSKKQRSDLENSVTIDEKPIIDAEVMLETKAAAQALGEDVANLDDEDMDDPLMAAEYVVEIFEYLKQLETATMPNPDYISHQDDLEWKMRGILVDWLIEVHTRFRLLPETLFLAVNIIDRFLSAKVVGLDRLQLVGVTAMFIASKYEEVLSPHVANFRHVADDGFSETEILSAERFVLSALNYDLSYPNPMNFLRRISKADDYDIQTRTLGKYLMEISLLDHRFMKYRQSHVAAASMYLARRILERGDWVSISYTPMGTTG